MPDPMAAGCAASAADWRRATAGPVAAVPLPVLAARLTTLAAVEPGSPSYMNPAARALSMASAREQTASLR